MSSDSVLRCRWAPDATVMLEHVPQDIVIKTLKVWCACVFVLVSECVCVCVCRLYTKDFSFSGEAKDSVNFSFFILLHKRAKTTYTPPYIHSFLHPPLRPFMIAPMVH